MIKPSTRVFRKQLLEGVAIPAIIRNGSYFFVDIDVYENGRVACWNFEDFKHFKKDVARGWVSTSIPNGDSISIHGLGDWVIGDGKWLFDQRSFINYVQSLIHELNPGLENMYTYSQKIINGVRIGESGNGTAYKELQRIPNDPFPDKINGNSTNLFYKENSGYCLVRVNAFADNTIQISRLANPINTSIEDFEKLVEAGIIASQIPDNSPVLIYGLGSFVAVTARFDTSITDKLNEIKDVIRKLNGQMSTLDICRHDYETYMANPTAENRTKLKTSYERIPDHQKIYVGDMDTKDIAVRMILYGKNEIENWSHYQLAKQLGEELPTIKIPNPSDDSGSE